LTLNATGWSLWFETARSCLLGCVSGPVRLNVIARVSTRIEDQAAPTECERLKPITALGDRETDILRGCLGVKDSKTLEGGEEKRYGRVHAHKVMMPDCNEAEFEFSSALRFGGKPDLTLARDHQHVESILVPRSLNSCPPDRLARLQHHSVEDVRYKHHRHLSHQ
jgi:hypothetical protein